MAEVLEFISKHNIYEYCDLLDFLDGACEFELFDFASSHTILFNTYLKSKRHNYIKRVKNAEYTQNAY